METNLILMRHGQSAWNEKNLFTGWVDIPLSQKGIEESKEGGEKIKNLPIDLVFTSTLVRAHMTVALALLPHKSGKIPVFLKDEDPQHVGWSYVHSEAALKTLFPVTLAWELNERMYGDLQGLNKAQTAAQFGEAQVQKWRRSFDEAPPHGESLKMTAQRAWPYFQQKILPHVQAGKHVFIAAHGNSLRAILMHLENLSKEEIVHLELKTGEPLVYTHSQGKWRKK